MKKLLTNLLSLLAAASAFSQNTDHDKIFFKESQPGYFQNTIMKDINESPVNAKPKEVTKSVKVDVTGKDFPTDPEQYKKIWHNKPISQGNTGTCWCFSTTSFFESEVYRITGQQVKLSEIYTVYWEYVERAKYFVAHRGDMNFGEGSETNAVAKIYRKYGIVPEDAYQGINYGSNFHSHAKMFDELEDYLNGVKEANAWNEEEVVSTVKSILNHYLGEPPTMVTINGKSMTPQDYCTNVLKLKLDEYVDFMSLLEQPFYTQAEYKVSDNWWRDKTYYNVPLEEFINGVKTALKNGYSLSIGGDVSEAGFNAEGNVAIIPTFDIPASYIDDNARQFRFSNKTTTDDHAMHIVGYTEKDGVTWFLVKDSGSGSRNCGESCKSFGYYFMREDYVKLKMMTMTVNKNAVKEMLAKFNKT